MSLGDLPSFAGEHLLLLFLLWASRGWLHDEFWRIRARVQRLG